MPSTSGRGRRSRGRSLHEAIVPFPDEEKDGEFLHLYLIATTQAEMDELLSIAATLRRE
ncbi:MAG: hypothetical protein HY720_08550 [Planctomycetes bacterium]|nr:hypothetical protein [Planctomycetota bacterium]